MALLSFINDTTVIDTQSWQEFMMSDLFDIKSSQYHDPIHYNTGNTPYIARSKFNNGEEKERKEVAEDKIYPANCIIIGGESACAFYQDIPFITGNNIRRIYAKKDKSILNKYIALFICSLLNKEGKKYDYGYTWTKERLEKTVIKLPVKNGIPDWEYLDVFIQTRYKNILTYL